MVCRWKREDRITRRMDKDMKYKVSYGGMMLGAEEQEAIAKSVSKNYWPLAEEGKLMEKEAAAFLGMKHGLLANSGSSAGLLALTALELPKGSEVIIPATTFPTIFNIILQCGLIPVVVDSKIGTYNLKPEELETAITKKTKAIIAVHILGNPCDMPKIMKIAKKHNLYVIEDNCDGWGSSIGKKKVGSFGHVSFTSFHAAHIVSMGQGGGVFTNDSTIAKNARMYRDWGRQADLTSRTNSKWKSLPKDYDSRFIYEKIGYNLAPLELQAAMGRIQLKRTQKIKELRKANFDYLYRELSKIPQLTMPIWLPNADVCWFSFPLYSKERGKLVKYLESKGIETRSMMAGNILKHSAYKKAHYRVGGKLTNANNILKYGFWVGVHPRMTQEDREYVVKVFKEFYAKTS